MDLYAEGFDPVLSADQRRRYHDTSVNRHGLEDYIARLTGTEGLIFQFPTWSFGPPAMLKGFFDRLFMPGVAFDLSDPNRVRPILGNVKNAGNTAVMAWDGRVFALCEAGRQLGKFVSPVAAGRCQAFRPEHVGQRVACSGRRRPALSRLGRGRVDPLLCARRCR